MTNPSMNGPSINWCLLKTYSNNHIKEERSPGFDIGLHKLLKINIQEYSIAIEKHYLKYDYKIENHMIIQGFIYSILAFIFQKQLHCSIVILQKRKQKYCIKKVINTFKVVISGVRG